MEKGDWVIDGVADAVRLELGVMLAVMLAEAVMLQCEDRNQNTDINRFLNLYNCTLHLYTVSTRSTQEK